MSKEKVLFNPSTLRNLADKSYERRKTAAVEIESLIHQLTSQPGSGQYINSIISTLVTDYTFSAQPNSRKGGLIALSSIAIALLHHSVSYLDLLLPPVLRCFVDQDARVRYYACESLYNIAKICRVDILLYINELFDGLCKLTADQDPDVRAACMLLDRLLKDIVANCDAFNIGHFLPLLRERIRLQHPQVRLLIVNWISMLNSLYDVSLVEYLPDLLGGLFAMLSDPHKDVKAQTTTLLSIFLRQITKTNNIEFATMIFPIVQHSTTSERTTRTVIVSWLHNFIVLAQDQLLPFLPHIIGALFCCIHDETTETGEIKQNALHCNELLIQILRAAPSQSTNNDFPTLLSHFIAQLSTSLLHARVVSLQWLSLLLEKYDSELFPFFDILLPPLLLALQSECDMQVFVLLIECIARLALISPPNVMENVLLTQHGETDQAVVTGPKTTATTSPPPTTTTSDQTNSTDNNNNNNNNNNSTNTNTNTNNNAQRTSSTNTSSGTNVNTTQKKMTTSDLLHQNILPPHFRLIFVNLLSLFATDVKFLELRAQRILCALSTFIHPKFVFAALCTLLQHNQDLIFTRLMVETLHLVLFTTEECAPLRQILIESAWDSQHLPLLNDLLITFLHSAVPAISLALLTQNYALASGIVSYMTASPNFHVSVGLLLQVEQFTQLFESSIFSLCRCHLLSVYAFSSSNGGPSPGPAVYGLGGGGNESRAMVALDSSSTQEQSDKQNQVVEHNFQNLDKNDQVDENIALAREQITALLHALYSLLAILPQSHCFFTLKNRLETSTVVQPFQQHTNTNSNYNQNHYHHQQHRQHQHQSQNASSISPSPLATIHSIITEAVQSPSSSHLPGQEQDRPTHVSTVSLKERMARQVALVQTYVKIQRKHDQFHASQQHASFLTTGAGSGRK